MEKVRKHINENYENYIEEISKTNYFKMSPIKDYIRDIINDTILNLFEKFSEKEIIEKFNSEARGYKMNNKLDGYIIYVSSLNMVSRNNKYIKYNNTFLNYDNIKDKDDFLIIDNNDDTSFNYLKNIENIDNILDNIEINYPFKIEIFKEIWGFNDNKINKKSFTKIAYKYNIRPMSVYNICKYVINLIKNNIDYET